MAPKGKAKAKAKAKEDEKKPEEEPKKRAAADAEEPPAKAKKPGEQPKEEPKEEKKEEAEKEKDGPDDKRPKIKESITWDAVDTTLNVVPTMGGKVLMSLSDGGMQFLIAGARANVGIKAGRYMFEAKVIEALNPTESSGNRAQVPRPRQLLRIGFSTASSSLILGECEDGICFDAEGAYTADKKKTSVSQRIGRNQAVAVLLNLDDKSPNFNTISLFCNGERICQPQSLPEALKGKTLYPHVSYRNISVQVNFGPNPLTPLPFTCRCLSTASVADVVVNKSSVPEDGTYDVMFPVAFPDEGTFEWLDTFLEKNPNYVELSDRKIIDWAVKSGVVKPKNTGLKNSMDKPVFNFGLTAMDDLSVRRVLSVVAPLVPRNYVVMEVKENLVAADRKVNVKRFGGGAYKKIAAVVMGEPNADFKKAVHSKLLKEKQEKANAEWKTKQDEKKRKKQAEARQKQLADMRKKAEEQRKKAEEEKKAKVAEALKKKAEEKEKKKAEEEAKKKADAAEVEEEEEEEDAKMEGEGEDTAESKEETKEEAKEETKDEVKDEVMGDAEDEEKKEEEKEETEAKEEPDEKKEEDDDEDKEPPPVELTEDEKKVWFQPPAVNDLTSQVLSQHFGSFTLPEKSEGFDDIRYEWDSAAKANEYLRTWVLDKKKLSRIEDLKPSEWFKSKYAAFTKSLKEWQDKQKPFIAKKKEEEKKAAEKEAAEDEEADEVEGDGLDIFAVEDVCDVGTGEPLFVSFTFEDWALLSLRYELFLLVQAYRKDVDDEERIGIHETNLAYYFNKYYHKQLNPKDYGKEANKDLVDFVKDAVTLDKETNVLKSDMEPEQDSFDIFVKLTEESRRERQRRVDAGDETARLKFNTNLGKPSRTTLVQTVGKPVQGAKATVATNKPTIIAAGGTPRPAVVRPGGYGSGAYSARPAYGAGYGGPRPVRPATKGTW